LAQISHNVRLFPFSGRLFLFRQNGIGIGIVGPQSPGLHLLADTLRQHTDPKDYMDTLREKIILQQENDNREPEQVQKARERSIRQDDPLIVVSASKLSLLSDQPHCILSPQSYPSFSARSNATSVTN
jgi:hypothetical protein